VRNGKPNGPKTSGRPFLNCYLAACMQRQRVDLGDSKRLTVWQRIGMWRADRQRIVLPSCSCWSLQEGLTIQLYSRSRVPTSIDLSTLELFDTQCFQKSFRILLGHPRVRTGTGSEPALGPNRHWAVPNARRQRSGGIVVTRPKPVERKTQTNQQSSGGG